MNKKNKVLLTSVGLAMLSGIAATGSTFAWFTTTRTASVSYSNATVTTNQSNLTIAYVASENTVDDTLTGNSLALTGLNSITDISGDGVAFFKPVWSAVPGVASQIDAVTAADGFYIDFTVAITASGNTSLNLYLGTGTEITSGNADALASARMAVYAEGAVKFIYAPDADYTDALDAVQTGHQYLSAASATEKTVIGTSQDAAKGVYAGEIFNSFTTFNTVSSAPTGSLVTTLTPVTGVDSTKNITFRIWLEGEDVEADNDAITGVLSASINFFALESI